MVERLHAIADDRSQSDVEERDWRQWAFFWAASQVQRECGAATWRAFWLTAVEGSPPADVAEKLEMKVGAVYTAKCRVLARIRERMQTLTEEEPDHAGLPPQR